MTFFKRLLILSFIFLNSGHAHAAGRARQLMGTLCEITSPHADTAFAEIARLEDILSTFRPESEVSRLNASAGSGRIAVSADLWSVLSLSLDFARASGGAFDPAYSSTPRGRGWHNILLFPGTKEVELAVGTRLDFGAIGKGFAMDAAATLLKKKGVRSAFMNFGGQILAFGDPQPVRIGSDRLFSLKDSSLSTSGLMEQPGHIIDPKTGTSSPDIGTVSVIAPTAAAADAWSTALYVVGLDRLPADFGACAIVIDGTRTTTRGDCRSYKGDLE